MAVATWEDVAVALGISESSVTGEQQAQIEHWLAGVELLIRKRFGSLALLNQEDLLYVESEAVAAKARPFLEAGGAESVTVAVDDANVTRRYKRAVAASDITDDWWALLAPTATTSAFTINPFPRRRGCW